ncbi:MAG: DUF413 domain-containing protein [Phycisphaeraceae bacterium]
MGKALSIFLPATFIILVINQTRYGNCYEPHCLAAALPPVMIMSAIVTAIICAITSNTDTATTPGEPINPAPHKLNAEERVLLRAHYEFYRSLDSGSRQPTTRAQEHFVSVCSGTATPTTKHERTYLNFKRLVGRSGLTEEAIVKANFLFPNEID